VSIKRVIYEVSWKGGCWYTDDKQQAIAKRRMLVNGGAAKVHVYIHKLRLKELMKFACNLLNQNDCFYYQGELTDE
jgi:hypothetical protein